MCEAACAVSVGVTWLDLTRFKQYVWLSFAGAPAEASDQPAAVAHARAVG
jgi:hypothetical protein